MTLRHTPGEWSVGILARFMYGYVTLTERVLGINIDIHHHMMVPGLVLTATHH